MIKQGIIANASLKVVGDSSLPLIEITFLVNGKLVPFALFPTEEKVTQGPHEGLTKAESALITLTKLGFKGSSITDIMEKSVSENFNTQDDFDVNVINKNGYPKINYVAFQKPIRKDQDYNLEDKFSLINNLIRQKQR